LPGGMLLSADAYRTSAGRRSSCGTMWLRPQRPSWWQPRTYTEIKSIISLIALRAKERKNSEEQNFEEWAYCDDS